MAALIDPPVTPPAAAHVVRISRAEGKAVPLAIVNAPTLPDFMQARLRTIAAPWRDAPIIAAEALRLQQVENLGGLVLWYDSGALPVPRPLPRSIVPVDLTEAEPLVLDIARAAAGPLDEGVGVNPAADAWERLLLRAGVTEGELLIGAAVLTSVFLAMHYFDRMGLVAIMAFYVLLRVLAHIFLGSRWVIAAGEVRVRRAWQRREGGVAFTPRDALLVIRRARPGWRAALYGDRTVARRLMSTREMLALMSAWISRG